MAYTTKRPTGLSIKRSGAYFVCTWKIGDEDYSQGQSFQWRVPGGKWKNVVIGNATTQKTITIDTSKWYPYRKPRIPSIIVRIRGRRGRFDGKNPVVSAWTQKEYDVQLPPRPTLTATLSSSQNNVTTFAWDTSTSNDSYKWCSRCQYQTALVTRGTVSGEEVPHSAWSAPVAVATSDSVAITEDSSTINKGTAYIRWFRVRSQGPQGFSEWVYAKHIYAVPYQTKNVKASARMTDAGGYLCTATWKTSKDVLHPVSAINVQYLITIPAEGMTCPDGVSWTEAMTLAYKDGSDAAAFSVDNVVGTDQCLFVRINTVHDRNITYGNATLVASGPLATPTNLSVTADDSTHMAAVTATNASQVPDAYMAVVFKSKDEPNGCVVGIIPHGQTQVTVTCPAWSSQNDIQFGVYAVVGDYTVTTRADGVGSYAIDALAKSAMQTYGGTVPAAPETVTVEQTATAGNVRVTFKWSWALATMAELSWADHEDAWESTDEPNTYIVSRLHASQWTISGLETGRTWYVRVRLASGAGNDVTYGAYSDIVSIDLSSAPSVPILSLSSAVITEDGVVTASWAYTSTDGTGQESADIAEVVNGVYSVFAEVASEQTITLSGMGWQSGEVHHLAVRVTSESGKQSAWSDPVSVTVAEPITAEITQTSLVEETVEENPRTFTGAMVSYESEIAGSPVTSLKVNLDPVQDGTGAPSPSNVRPISGYDSVKVARMGKNLCAPFADSTGSANGIDYTFTDNVIEVSGTTTKANADTPDKYLGGANPVPIILRQGVTYTASLVGKVEASNSVRLMLKNEGTLKLYYNSDNGIWTFTPETTQEINQVSLCFPTSGTVVDIEAKLQIEVGDRATSYEEYSGDVYNIFLTPTGENLFDINTVFADTSKFTIENGTVSGTATNFSNAPYSIPSSLVGKKLKFSVNATLGATPNHVRVSATVNGTAINGEWVEANTSGSSSVIFTPTSTSDVVRVVFGSSGSGVITISNVRLEEVNTVYGGTLDVISGELIIDRASVVMDGSSDEGWYVMTTANIFRANAFTPTPASGATAEDFANHPIVSNCTNTSRYNYNTMKDAYPCVSFNDQGRLYLAISADTTTIEQALAWLAQNNLQLVYYLAEPQTIQLTPQQIASLLGNNNMWSDAGSLEVTVADEVRDICSLTEMPLSVTVEGAGEGGVTSVIIERSEDYHVDRPDETEYDGYEGETICIYTQTGEGQIVFGLEDLLGRFDDEASYRIIATVQDGLGQSAEVTLPFEVHWTHQAIMPTATVSILTDDMAAVITPTAVNPAEGDVCDIYRLSVDKPELIYPDAEFGTAYVDPYPAIGDFGGHRVVYKTANGDYITATNHLAWADYSDGFSSDSNIIDFDEGQVLVEFNTDLSHSWSKDFKETKYLGGSVKGDWNPAVSRTGTFSGVCTTSDADTIELMRRLAVHAGVCHVRTKDGSSYAADVQVGESYAQDTAHKIITFNLSITRIDSEGYDGMTLEEWRQTHAVE